jgi:hypothetical protein
MIFKITFFGDRLINLNVKAEVIGSDFDDLFFFLGEIYDFFHFLRFHVDMNGTSQSVFIHFFL